MGAVENLEIRCVEALDADADAVEEMQSGKCFKVFGSEVFGIGFNGCFFELRKVEEVTQGDYNLGKKFDGE